MALNLELLNGSFLEIAQEGEAFVETFYEKLFKELPEVRLIFPEDMESQRWKLLISLSTIISAWDKPELVESYIAELGRRHQSYAVAPHYYGVVIKVFLETLTQYLGPEWTPELQAAWTQAYESVAAMMVKSYQAAA